MENQAFSHLTEEELIDVGVFPHGLSDEEYTAVQRETGELRLRQLAEMTPEQRLKSKLLSIYYKRRLYLQKDVFLEENSFGNVLKEYLQALDKNANQLADDLNVPQNQLTRLLNNQEEPNLDIAWKLEYHSGGILDALFWWKLSIKKQEHLLNIHEKQKKVAVEQVKNALKIAA